MKKNNNYSNLDKDFLFENETVHRILDLSLPLEERLKKAVTMPSAQTTADFLGVKVQTVFANRTVGKKIKSRLNNKEYAIRVVNKPI